MINNFIGFNNVLASLYNNEIEIHKDYISGVIAAASMLNLVMIFDKFNILDEHFKSLWSYFIYLYDRR